MPKSKRNRVVTLSKTQKKGREHKESLVSSLRKALDEYKSLYVFSFENMRNQLFKELRDTLKTSSRFFMGGNKVLQIALGKSNADEVKDNLHKASALIEGDRGLFLTNLPKEEVLKIFSEFEGLDFARTGSVATETVELPEGPLDQFTHDMEPFLRKQGMPVRLNKGVVELVADYTVCTEGDPVSPEASRILFVFGKFCYGGFVVQLAGHDAFKVWFLSFGFAENQMRLGQSDAIAKHAVAFLEGVNE